MSITASNLTKKFKDFVAVNDVSFKVERGETFALLGPNGSGKTTTLKCLLGLTLPTAGSVVVEGFDLQRSSRAARQQMSFVPQRVSFSEQLTGYEVLNFFARLRRVPRQRIDETISTPNFDFNGFFNKPVGEYSGGMIQRLGLAVACLPDAPVMVLDEPTASLDPGSAIQFREFLKSLKGKGKTVIFSSHMLPDVEQLADRVAIMVDGRLVALRHIAALREELSSTARMRVSVANIDSPIAEAAITAGATSAKLEGSSLVISARPEDRLEILRAIEVGGGKVQHFSTEELSLEDIYLKYVTASPEGATYPG